MFDQLIRDIGVPIVIARLLKMRGIDT